MDAAIIGIIVSTCAFTGALIGIRLSAVLPEHQLNAESRGTVKLGIGLVATMTALVLGLITASAKDSFDAVDTAVKQSAIEILTLDRVLVRYGSEASEIRKSLQRALETRIDMIWPQDSSKPINIDLTRTVSTAEGPADAIQNLKPRDDSQRALQARAGILAESLLQTRWLTIAVTGTSIPVLFLVILSFWLTITFVSFGLFAPRNGLVVAVLFVCALSVGSAVFLIVEMDTPFEGLLKVSPEPLRYAHAHLNQ